MKSGIVLNVVANLDRYASYALGFLFLVANTLFFLMIPWLGIREVDDLMSPEVMLPVLQAHPFLPFVYLLGTVIALCIVALAVGTMKRVRESRWTQLSMGLAICSASLVIVADTIRIVGFRQLIAMLENASTHCASLFLSVNTIAHAINVAAVFLFGAWIATLCILYRRLLPRWHRLLGWLVSVVHLACILIPIPSILDIFWFLFFGYYLSRNQYGHTTNAQ